MHKVFRNCLVVLSLLFLASCSTYTHYSYNSNELVLDKAKVTLVFGERYNEETKSKVPAGIQFWITADSATSLSNFEVREIELINPLKGQIQRIDNLQGRKPRKLSQEPGKLNSVASFNLNLSEPPPEVLVLKATIVIYYEDSTTIEEESIEVRFKLNVGKERHWNWFDEQMSV